MTRPVRFLHLADVHLGAAFAGVDATDARVRQALVRAPYEAFDRAIDLAVERAVDFVAIAGDLYNHAERNIKAQFAVQAAASRLAKAGIPAFVARGNHDPEGGGTAQLALPDSFRSFASDRVERIAVSLEGEEVCGVYGRSYARAAETRNLASEFGRHADDRVSVGVLHANFGGSRDHEPYAPCGADDLRASRMDYWALGHIHLPGTVLDEPLAVYAGSAQGLNPKERGARGCFLVEIDENGPRVEFVETCSVRWEAAKIDLSGIESLDALREAVADACAGLSGGGRPVISRLELNGRTPVHRELRRSGLLADVLEQARDDAMMLDPWVWLDRMVVRTEDEIDLEQLRCSTDFVGEVVRAADGYLAEGAGELVQESIAPLLDKLGLDAGGLDASDIVVRARTACLDALGVEGSS